MSYKLKLEAIKTVKELFDFRDELKSDAKKYSELWHLEKTDPISQNLAKCQEANYFIERVEVQIRHFEREGLILTSIEIPKQEVKERTFTETEISHLQSSVHKITGDGEVMGLFNQLLGVAAGSGS
jgi:sortase (surface protein transpeptidase)